MTSLLALNEQIIRSTDLTTQAEFYYGFDLTISQSDVPYVVSSSSRPASQYHFVVCADTVTINERLMNPGKDIRIYARQVIFQPGAILDVGGSDPVTSFAPGQLPQQTNNTPGAMGATGVDASGGSGAGNIIIVAESVIGQAGVVEGSINISLIDWSAFTMPIAAALVGNALSPTQPASEPVGLENFSIPISVSGLSISGSAAFSNVQVSGELDCDSPDITVSPLYGTMEVSFALSNLQLSADIAMSIQGANSPAENYTGTMSASGASIQATVSFTSDYLTGGGTSPTMSSLVVDYQPSFTVADSGLSTSILEGLLNDQSAEIQQQIQQQIQAAILGLFSDVISNFKPAPTPDGVLITIGGTGGRGQDGQNGVKGAQGENGVDSSDGCTDLQVMAHTCQPPPETIGQQGAQGGQGGNAGHSGNGGTGGSVQLNYVIPTAAVISIDDSGGNGGPAANPGAGGLGGDPGAPGTYQITYPLGYHAPETATSTTQGPGPQGLPATFNGNEGDFGVDGSASVNGSPVQVGTTYASATYEQIAPYFPVEQLLITQRVASFAYLDAQTADDYQTVMQLLLWLNNITSPFMQSGFSPANWQPTDITLAQKINTFANSLISNFRSGLDFYGHPADWVPIITLGEYQSNLAALLTIGEDVETQFNDYMADQQTQENQLTALQNSNAKLQQNLQNVQQQVTSIGTQITQADATITNLDAQLQAQQTYIVQETQVFTQAFKQYVESQANCTFNDVVTGIGALLQVATGAATGVGLISGAFAAENALDTGLKEFKYAISVVEKISSTISAIQSGITKIRGLIPNPNPNNLTGLLVTDQQDFDTFITQFLNEFQAATTLKQAVDDYFALVNSLNQAIVSYNGLYITQATLQAQVDQYTQQLEQMGAVLAQSQPDPTLPTCISFMQSVYDSLKVMIVNQLYEENRAYYFWSLQDQPFSTDDLTIASLANTHGQLVNDILAAQERSLAPYNPFTEQVTISAADFPVAFGQLPTSQQLTFSIDPNAAEFNNMFQVIAESYKLSFPDIEATSGVLFTNLQHPGTSYQMDTDGQTIQFTHDARIVPYKIDYGDSTNTGGGALGSQEQGFSGLSPFTLWTLDFNESGNSWVALSKIQSVVITFEGTFAGPPNIETVG